MFKAKRDDSSGAPTPSARTEEASARNVAFGNREQRGRTSGVSVGRRVRLSFGQARQRAARHRHVRGRVEWVGLNEEAVKSGKQISRWWTLMLMPKTERPGQRHTNRRGRGNKKHVGRHVLDHEFLGVQGRSNFRLNQRSRAARRRDNRFALGRGLRGWLAMMLTASRPRLGVGVVFLGADGFRLLAAARAVAAAPTLLGHRRAEAGRLDAAIGAVAGETGHSGHDGHRCREPDKDRHGCSEKQTHYYTCFNSSCPPLPSQGHPPSRRKSWRRPIDLLNPAQARYPYQRP